MDKIYTIKEVAEKLNVSEKTVRRYIAKSALTAFKIGGRWRIKEEDLHNYMNHSANDEFSSIWMEVLMKVIAK